MSRESNLWRYISQGMGRRWSASRHEDMIGLGVPDVSYGLQGVQGWIELKVLDDWPKNPKTIVQFRKFTTWQRRWLLGRGRHGDRTWLLVKIKRVFLLFHWSSFNAIGTTNRKKLIAATSGVWTSRIDWDDFERILKEGGEKRC